MATPSEAQMLNDLLGFLQEAGEIALEKQEKARSQQQVKGDRTIVTETDLEISRMYHAILGFYAEDTDHLLIDEETALEFGTPSEVLGENKYTWILDPVDGTTPYAWGRNRFGITLGVMKDSKPWIGGTYLPAQGILFFSDGEKSWMVTNPFTDEEEKEEITPIKPHSMLSATPVEHDYLAQEIYEWEKGTFFPTNELCFVQQALNLLRCESACMVTRISPWDVLGSWASLKAAGIECFNVETNDQLTEMTADVFRDDWYSKDIFIFCHPENYEVLKKGLIKRETRQKLEATAV